MEVTHMHTQQQIKAVCRAQGIARAHISKRVYALTNKQGTQLGSLFTAPEGKFIVVFYIDRDNKITRFAWCRSQHEAKTVCEKQATLELAYGGICK